jgi:hypothetical protein
MYTTVLATPVNPVILHGLIVIAVLTPIAVVTALVAIRRGARPWRAFAVSLALAIGVGAIGTVIVESGDEPAAAMTATASTGLSMVSEEVLEGLLIGWIALVVVVAVVVRPRVMGSRHASV